MFKIYEQEQSGTDEAAEHSQSYKLFDHSSFIPISEVVEQMKQYTNLSSVSAELQDLKCPQGSFVQDFKLVYNKADSSTKALKIMCEDPVHKTKSELTSDQTEQFSKVLTLANTDPYYVCGLQFKYNSTQQSETD